MRLLEIDFFSSSPPATTTKYPIEWALVQEPNLWTPGKKPTGPVEIDWSHPLTNGLVSCRILNQAHRGQDLVFNDDYTITGNPFDNRAPNDFYIDYGVDKLIYGTNPASLIGTEYTFITSIGRFSASPGNRFVIGSNNSINYDYGFYSIDSGLSFFHASGNSINCVTGLSSPYDYENAAVSYDGTNIYAYPSGLSEAASSLTSTYNFGIGNPWYTTTNEYKVKHLYIYDRYMDAEEIRSLFLDPYQILKPAGVEQ